MVSLFDVGPFPPCPASFNMAAHVLDCAATHPDKVALSILGLNRATHWRYGELRSAVLATGQGLLAAGASPGDRVLLRLGNTVEYPIAYLAAIAVGIVPIPTSPQLTAAEVAKVLTHLDPTLILHDADVSCAETDRPVLNTRALRAFWGGPEADWQMGDPNRPAYIVYTSGTSGTPRAVVHAHRAVWARQMMHTGWLGVSADDRLLHAGAFNWTYTMGVGLMDPWRAGATALIPEPGVAAEQLPLILKSYEATIFAAAPGVYRKFLKQGSSLNLPKIRHGVSAGEKLSQSIADNWRQATGTPIFEAYGLSECSTFLSGSPSQPAPPGTLGRPQPGRRVAILGDDGPVPIGTPGVISVHRADPGLMLGYEGAAEATAAKMQGDWFRTGDLGQMDADGAITYLGRDDDMMNAGGFRVSPLEVEAALADCPGIGQIAVTDIEIKTDVRIIAAFYTSDTPQKDADLRAYASTKLADYKQPRAYYRVDHIPANANGKVARKSLHSLLEG
ncbi:acyl--CoA ligase [Pseudohalocynthiibacter aestuariivivens]|nr:class I adenylate-forming enzyme family protein [Pseudohalocynthiibacter aestuariivivens]QIE44433.1 acyl--CoA ligase [Pseudohalocynthiibacter aestuariivivens]